MFTEYSLTQFNDHIIIDNGQSIVFDTGSPMSFHDSGIIDIGGDSIAVPRSLLGVTSNYLTENIGCELHGLLGMDIITKHPLMIELKSGFMFFDDDDNYGNKFHSIHTNQLGGLIGIEIMINGRFARMFVDSGAKISYINKAFTNGLPIQRTADDYSPYIGKFQTSLFCCETHLLVNNCKPYIQEYGTPPQQIEFLLNQYHMDGIIGIELFKRFRLHLLNGELYFPPQGI